MIKMKATVRKDMIAIKTLATFVENKLMFLLLAFTL